MKYIITDTTVIRLSERAGTLQNISGVNSVEISESGDFTNSIVLFSLNKITFNTPLYVRAYGKLEHAVELNVVPFALDNSGGSGSSSGTVADEDVTTDDEANEYFDSIFGGNGGTATVPDEDVASDNEADEYFDSIFGDNP